MFTRCFRQNQTRQIWSLAWQPHYLTHALFGTRTARLHLMIFRRFQICFSIIVLCSVRARGAFSAFCPENWTLKNSECSLVSRSELEFCIKSKMKFELVFLRTLLFIILCIGKFCTSFFL